MIWPDIAHYLFKTDKPQQKFLKPHLLGFAYYRFSNCFSVIFGAIRHPYNNFLHALKVALVVCVILCVPLLLFALGIAYATNYPDSNQPANFIKISRGIYFMGPRNNYYLRVILAPDSARRLLLPENFQILPIQHQKGTGALQKKNCCLTFERVIFRAYSYSCMDIDGVYYDPRLCHILVVYEGWKPESPCYRGDSWAWRTMANELFTGAPIKFSVGPSRVPAVTVLGCG